jgi:hypothetical protein
VRISRIRLSDHLLPAACAASSVDGSLSLPFGTGDSVYTGTDSSSASEPTANCVGVCVGAITAARSARPKIAFAPDGRSLITSVGAAQSEVWLHRNDGEVRISSEGSGRDPSVSPDGKKIYYVEEKDVAGGFQSGELWIAEQDTMAEGRFLVRGSVQAGGSGSRRRA